MHTDKRRNDFLKHKRVKHFLSNLNNNANETSASWYDVTHDDDLRWIAILKRLLNCSFLAFSGVIYQNLLHRWVYIAVSSSKLLFSQFCEKPLHITFKLACWLVIEVVNETYICQSSASLSRITLLKYTISNYLLSNDLSHGWWSISQLPYVSMSQESYLSHREHAVRFVNWNLANSCTVVQKVACYKVCSRCITLDISQGHRKRHNYSQSSV